MYDPRYPGVPVTESCQTFALAGTGLCIFDPYSGHEVHGMGKHCGGFRAPSGRASETQVPAGFFSAGCLSFRYNIFHVTFTIDNHAVPAFALRSVQGRVGRAHQGFDRIAASARGRSDTGAYRDAIGDS